MLSRSIPDDIQDQTFATSIRMDYRTVCQLDLIRDRYCWSRAQLIRFLVHRALSEIDMSRVDCLGILPGLNK